MPKRIFIILALAALAAGAFYVSRHRDAATPDTDGKKAASPPVPVQIITAVTSDIPIYVSGIGNVIALNQVVVRSRVDGELVKINFVEGQTVDQGDLLALIDDRAIRADLARAKAEKASNQARLLNSQLNLKRYDSLLKDDAIARQTVDQETANVKQLQAAVDVSQAAVDTALVQLSLTRITAPLSGYVGIRNVDAGNIVRSSDTNGLVTLTQIAPIAILFSVPQTALNDVLPVMQKDDRPVEIFARENERVIATGQLQAVDSQIDPTTGTIRLKAVSPNAPQTLWPGQFFIVRLQTGLLQHKIALPLTALQRKGDAAYVYRVKDETQTEQVPVWILLEEKDRVVVEDAQPDSIASGDRIVMDGQSRLKPDSMIKIVTEPKTASPSPDQTAGAAP